MKSKEYSIEQTTKIIGHGTLTPSSREYPNPERDGESQMAHSRKLAVSAISLHFRKEKRTKGHMIRNPRVQSKPGSINRPYIAPKINIVIFHKV